MTAVKPSDLNDQKAYELQEVCNRWGIQTSGNKKVLIDRLNLLFSGAPVPKKNCTMKFLRLIDEGHSSGSEVEKVAGTFRAPILEPKSFAAPKPKAKCKPSSDESAYMSHEAPKSEKKPDKQIHLSDLEEGKPVDSLRCDACNVPMVPRRNRLTGSPFFGCSNFPKTGCRFTKTSEQGLQTINSQGACGSTQ